MNTNFVGFVTPPFGRVGLKLVGETNAKYGSEFNARSNVSCILFSALDNFDDAGDNKDGACCCVLVVLVVVVLHDHLVANLLKPTLHLRRTLENIVNVLKFTG